MIAPGIMAYLGGVAGSGCAAAGGLMALAAGGGLGLGWLINQSPAVQDSQRFYGNALVGGRDSLPAANLKGPKIHHDKEHDFRRIYPLENSAGHTREECDEIYEAVLRRLNRMYQRGNGSMPRYEYARLVRELDDWHANCLANR